MQEEVAIVTRQIVNKILHPPMVRLRERPKGDDILHSISLVRSIFALDRTP
jgi:glutamyl-tRNA reductase